MLGANIAELTPVITCNSSKALLCAKLPPLIPVSSDIQGKLFSGKRGFIVASSECKYQVASSRPKEHVDIPLRICHNSYDK